MQKHVLIVVDLRVPQIEQHHHLLSLVAPGQCRAIVDVLLLQIILLAQVALNVAHALDRQTVLVLQGAVHQHELTLTAIRR